MAFLGLPCPCGGSQDDPEPNVRVCVDCGRRFEKQSWGWCQVTPKSEIRDVQRCKHKRIVGNPCPHCQDGIAKEYHGRRLW